MRLKAKEQIKVLLSQEGIKQKDLAKMLSEKTGHVYSQTNISQKMSRGSFTYNEVMIIAEILGYDIQYIKQQ